MPYRHEFGGAAGVRIPLRRRRNDPSSDAEWNEALAMAIRLSRSPHLARNYRSLPLPAGLNLLIRVAGGCEESRNFVVGKTGIDLDTIQRVVVLYLLVVLFDGHSDPYRTLGVAPGTAMEEMRDHKKWLLKWLHPDRNPNPSVAALSVRVLDAWQEISSAPASDPAVVQAETAPVVVPPEGEPGQPAQPAAEGQAPRRRKIKGHIWLATPLA